MTISCPLDFPFHFDHRGRTAATDLADHVRDMIEQFLMTDPGERVNRPDFGSGLRQLVFAPNSPELAATLEFGVRAGLQQWLGDLVAIDALDVTADDAQLTVALRYTLRATGEVRDETLVRAL